MIARSPGGPGRRPRGGAPIVGALAAVVLFAVPGGLAGASPPGVAAPAIVHTTPYIQHVVMIVLENQGRSTVWGHAPYERYLAGTYGNASDAFAACHPSAPNYLSLVAAVTNQCGTDAWYNDTNTTLGDRLTSAGYTWAQFAENLPTLACLNPGGVTAGLFATRHVPFLYFRNVLKSPTTCLQDVRPASNFTGSIVNGTLPNYSFYTPNLCDDGHTGCGGNTTSAQLAAQADAWLQGFLAPILNHTGRFRGQSEQRLIRHTLFVVVWDEDVGVNTGFTATNVSVTQNFRWCKANGAPKGDVVCGGPVYLALVSKFCLGLRDTAPVTSYNLVRTVEWLFHLPSLNNTGRLDAKAAFPALTPLFSFRSNGR